MLQLAKLRLRRMVWFPKVKWLVNGRADNKIRIFSFIIPLPFCYIPLLPYRQAICYFSLCPSRDTLHPSPSCFVPWEDGIIDWVNSLEARGQGILLSQWEMPARKQSVRSQCIFWIPYCRISLSKATEPSEQPLLPPSPSSSFHPLTKGGTISWTWSTAPSLLASLSSSLYWTPLNYPIHLSYPILFLPELWLISTFIVCLSAPITVSLRLM